MFSSSINLYINKLLFGGLIFDLQKLFPAPAPFGPVCSAYWQLRTEQWHSDPPLHKPEWEARSTYTQILTISVAICDVKRAVSLTLFTLTSFAAGLTTDVLNWRT